MAAGTPDKVAKLATSHAVTTGHDPELTSQIHRRADRKDAGRVVLKIHRRVEDGKDILCGYLDGLGVPYNYILGSYKHICIVSAAALKEAELKAKAEKLEAMIKAHTATLTQVNATANASASATAQEMSTTTVTPTLAEEQEQVQSSWQPSWQPGKYAEKTKTEPVVTVGATGKNWGDLEWD